MAKTHSYEDLAQDLAAWVEDTAQAIAGAVREGRNTPFAATASRQDVLGYYRVKFASPTGGLLAPEQALMTPDGQRIGPLGVKAVYAQLAKGG